MPRAGDLPLLRTTKSSDGAGAGVGAPAIVVAQESVTTPGGVAAAVAAAETGYPTGSTHRMKTKLSRRLMVVVEAIDVAELIQISSLGQKTPAVKINEAEGATTGETIEVSTSTRNAGRGRRTTATRIACWRTRTTSRSHPRKRWP